MSFLNNTAASSQLDASQNKPAGAFFGALGTSAAIFAAQVAIFVLIKDKLPRLYEPRTYLVPESDRASSPPKGIWRWIKPVWSTSSVDIVHKCGLDAYFFLRFLAMLVKLFLPMLLLVIPVLFCVNAIGGRGTEFLFDMPYSNNVTVWQNQTQTQLNILTWSNVRPDQHRRYWAHLILAVIVIGWFLYVFYDEMRGFVRLRQAYLLSPQHRIRASATTVLVQAMPEKWCNVEALDGLFDVYPGGVRNIWVNRKYDSLLDLVKERNKLAIKLEKAETELVRKCRTANLKKLDGEAKKSGKKISRKDKKTREAEETQAGTRLAMSESNTTEITRDDEVALMKSQASPGVVSDGPSSPEGEPRSSDSPSSSTEHTHKPSVDARINKDKDETPPYDEQYDPCNDGEPLWKKYIEQKDRPTMRLALWNKGWLDWIPWTGKKVDTIEHCQKEVARLTQEIERQQAKPESFPVMNSAFIQFNSQIAAHMACQSVAHHVPDMMTPRLVEISPGDVIWENMSFQWWERWLRTVLVLTIIAGLIIFFAVPSTIIALLSQLQSLGQQYTWLAWIEKIPSWAQQGLQGILPPALTGLLLLLVPIFMRFMSRMRGTPTGMLVELDVSNYYFAFAFFELFLVITLAAGILPIISSFNITGIPSLLASQIPKASNYYFSYLILQGLSTSSSALLQLVTLLVWFFWAPLNDNTPRQKWNRQVKLPSVNWGNFFPVFTNLACIGMIYSIVAPLIIFFNLISFSLFWFVYRYLTLYVNVFKFDTGGLLFPKAINQLFTGIYVMEICLIGLFFLVQDVDDNGNADGTPCKAQGIIMIVVLILTIAFQIRMNLSFSKLSRYLPITLEDDAAERDETFALMQQKKFGGGGGGGDGAGDADIEDKSVHSIEEILEERERRSAEDIEMHKLHQKHQEEPERQATDQVAAALKKNNADNKEKVIYDNFATRGVLDIAKKPLNVVGLAKGQIDKGVDRLQLHQRMINQRLGLELPEGVEKGLNSHGAVSDALFAGMHGSIEELSPEERDSLTKEAFKHAALRARRPIMWIPNDELGVAADEIARTKKFSPFLDISSEGTALNGKGQVIFAKSPPDFRDEDLIDL